MKNVTIPSQFLQELLALCGPEDHELRERVLKSAAPTHPAEGVLVQAVLDGGTPGPWRVRKRTNDAGEVLDCFTWQEAHASLVADRQAKVKRAQEALDKAQRALDRAMDMKPNE